MSVTQKHFLIQDKFPIKSLISKTKTISNRILIYIHNVSIFSIKLQELFRWF